MEIERIKELEGREKIQPLVIANKLNEVIEYLNEILDTLNQTEDGN